MVDGQPAAFKLSAAGMLAADAVVDVDVEVVVLLLPLEQAAAVTASAVLIAAVTAIRVDLL
jgi:hypothetical protein